MGKGEHVTSFKVGATYIEIENTLGCMDHTYSAQLLEPFVFGSGNTQEDAVKSMVEGMRRKANEIESIAAAHFSKADKPPRVLDIDIGDGHKYKVQVDHHGIVLATACEGRWPMTHTRTDSKWLDEQLQAAAHRQLDNEWPDKSLDGEPK